MSMDISDLGLLYDPSIPNLSTRIKQFFQTNKNHIIITCIILILVLSGFIFTIIYLYNGGHYRSIPFHQSIAPIKPSRITDTTKVTNNYNKYSNDRFFDESNRCIK